MFKTSLNEQNPIDKVLERLQGVRRSGKGWVARCPAHEDRTPSLSVAEGHDGRVLIKCFAGCTLEAILGALGLEVRDLFPHDDDPWRWTRAPKLPSPRPKPAPRPDEERRRRLERLWAQAVPVDRPGAEVARRYLAVRGVPLEALPATPLLRLHRGLIYREGEEVLGAFPALLARVEHPHHGLVALHRTYLAPDGTGKAPVPNPKKLTTPTFDGATRGAGIRLFPLGGEEVAVAEGIETALAVAVATGLPAYAAVSAGGLEAWIPPAGVRAVLIAADGDDTGKGAALALAKRLLAVGVKVRLAVPQEEGKDWADLVKAMEAVVAASQEVEHAQEEA